MALRNRGKQPNDDKLFSEKWYARFKDAADDMGYLLSRGYGINSALQLVGNRYKLNKRQRVAIQRISASEQEIALRNSHLCNSQDLAQQRVEIDGFNLLILLESALSGGYIFKCRDACYRDMSSVHGSYKRVIQTEEAITKIGECLQQLGVSSAMWYLDKPVSNSGRLKMRLLEMSAKYNYHWEVELVYSPDKVLAESPHIVISSDGWILNQAEKWFNLGQLLLEQDFEGFNIIEV